ncbi:hypothetical protein U9M48_018825 [Paspalum notatum var. saurae]|uniref:Uncharacterized protein n=1 Tax=Paspalum notatum var. saurae TaxID=547442 RepID=A0AAQ3TAY8_PASNO
MGRGRAVRAAGRRGHYVHPKEANMHGPCKAMTCTIYIYRYGKQPCCVEGSPKFLLTTLLRSTSSMYTDDDDDATAYVRSSSGYTDLSMLIYYYHYVYNAPFDTDEADDAGLHQLMDTDKAMDDADTPTSTSTPSHARISEAKTEDDDDGSLIGGASAS